jgi:hypothetical protein
MGYALSCTDYDMWWLVGGRICSVREADRPVEERVSVLDRPAAEDDLPPLVARLIRREPVERSSVRLALADDDRRVFVGRSGEDGLFLQFLDPTGGGSCAGPRSTLADLGAIVMWTSSRTRFVVTGVVADLVTAVRVGDVTAALQDNAFAAVVPGGAPDVVVVSTPDGERQVLLPAVGL